MRILGIDTSTRIASVALTQNGELIAEEIHSPRGSASHPNHAEVLLPLIDAVLRKSEASLSEVSGLAVSIGPGSFTGLRIGLSAVKGLAYGLGIPVVGISTLLANAARVDDCDGLICSFFDARENEVYAALFRRCGPSLTRLTEDKAAGAVEVIETIASLAGDAPCLFVGDGSKAHEDLLLDQFGNKALLKTGDSYASLASAVARLGGGRLQEADGARAASLVPVYLRSSVLQRPTLTKKNSG
jgi:tRNA threonylcarbamoyladenosine biosynthesis protein TsaB